MEISKCYKPSPVRARLTMGLLSP